MMGVSGVTGETEITGITGVQGGDRSTGRNRNDGGNGRDIFDSSFLRNESNESEGSDSASWRTGVVRLSYVTGVTGVTLLEVG